MSAVLPCGLKYFVRLFDESHILLSSICLLVNILMKSGFLLQTDLCIVSQKWSESCNTTISPFCVCILVSRSYSSHTLLLHLFSSSSSLRNYGLVTESQFDIGKRTVVCIFWSSCLSASSLFIADMTTCKSLWEAQQQLTQPRYVLSFIICDKYFLHLQTKAYSL